MTWTPSEGDPVWVKGNREAHEVVRYVGSGCWRVRNVDTDRRQNERTVAEHRLRPRLTSDTPADASHLPARTYRAGTTEQPEHSAQWKEPVWRSRAYLEHARETGRKWGCPGCGTDKQIEAMHFGSDGGMGLKASDFYAIGACHGCHRRTHGKHCAFPSHTPEGTKAIIRERQVKTMAAWLTREKGAA